MSSESQSIAQFYVVVIVKGSRKDYLCESHKEAVRRQTHERAYWAGDPDVTIYIETAW